MSKKQKTADLPPGCPTCNYGRAPFVMSQRFVGYVRCDCPRGIALSQLDRAKEVGR